MDNQQEIIIRNHPNRKGFISKHELEFLYLEQKLTDQEIGKKFGMSLGQVHRLRNKYNIKSIESYKRHHKQELDQKEKEFLIGVLLGDGHLRWRNKGSGKSYPELILEQSSKHFEYVLWLKEQIKDWIDNPNKKIKQVRKVNKKNGMIYHSYPLKTICHPVFIDFYNGFYVDSKKTLNIDFIKQYFTELSLSVWIMDDGTISKNRNIMICSNSFSKQENEELSKLLNEKFGISSKVLLNSHTKSLTYYLSFNKENSCKITELTKNIIIPSMRYKLISPETTKQSKLSD